ncbi:uncharacterized protein LOC121369672 [Gigantopelta aegis]|uniref:uncharacterized protein LOC121369672 n=1 Tax=Gigantopelta aegis TaxID=1735272 RepID=UPI001B88E074|nr:uncharacterized protein LOC121369672 [Gigantopelta aegis]
MSLLLHLFRHFVSKHEMNDATSYRTDQLKRRIQNDYPQLTFHSPCRKNVSELVFTETLSPDDLLEGFQSESELGSDLTPSDTDTEASCPMKSTVSGLQARSSAFSSMQTLYETSDILQRAIKEQPRMEKPWPPISDTMNIESCESVVPVELYNLLVWSIGVSEELSISERVSVPESIHLKLLSICQDVVYLASNGRRQTPKSLALGLTVQHLTGSCQLLDILNRFGHCASSDAIVGYETSLAQLQLETGGDIPKGFEKQTPTVMVWDNIDFGEETKSGAGTTHHTNGIMTQSKPTTSDEGNRTAVIKKGQRTLNPPPCQIEVYHQKKRHGPEDLTVSDHDLQMAIVKEMVVHARKTDLFYVILKYTQSDEPKIPGWRGFNIHLQEDGPLHDDDSGDEMD